MRPSWYPQLFGSGPFCFVTVPVQHVRPLGGRKTKDFSSANFIFGSADSAFMFAI
jgi:hypothetical protein